MAGETEFQNGKPIGTQVFPVIDTEKGELSAELQTVGEQEWKECLGHPEAGCI